jgi:saccharopine dehydrogenase-like NADP-dependent oxidoreductase
MKFDYLILGGTGQQGRIVARDLLEAKNKVLLCGRNKSRVEKILKRFSRADFASVDLRDISRTIEIIKKSGADVVINCAEGDWNLNALKACIRANVNSLDLGSEIWMTKKQFELDRTLKNKNLVHITGCGSVPGIGNVMLAYAVEKLDSISAVDVGFAWNSNIKKFVVPFSIQSIIEEFTDPATNIHDGKFAKIKPMETVHKYKDKFVGDEKSFYVRHPETYTFYHYYKNKGLKDVRFYAEFPPHSFDIIAMLIELGLGRKDDVVVNGVKVKPVELLTEVLKDLPIPDGYTEKEDLFVSVHGKKSKQKKIIRMQCIVPTLEDWKDAGCNIDTGIPASIIAQMIKNKIISKKGSFAPEAVVPPKLFFEELHKKNMIVYENGKTIN